MNAREGKGRGLLADALLFAAVFVVHALFFTSGSWNQNARYNTIFAFVEPGHPETGTLKINRLVAEPTEGYGTGDIACWGNDYFSNKAPGSSLMGIPLYAAIFYSAVPRGVPPEEVSASVHVRYVLNLWISVLWSALAAVSLRRLYRRLNPGPHAGRDSLVVAWIYGFATMIYPYDTQFWGHPTAAAFLVFGTSALFWRPGTWLAVAGFWFGCSGLVEYMVLIFLPPAFLLLCWRKDWPGALAFALGSIPPLAVLAWSQATYLGSVFHTFAGLTDSTLTETGWHRTSPEQIARLLIGFERGLLPLSPVLAVGLVRLLMNPAHLRREALLLSSVFIVSNLLLIGSYNGNGGLGAGPRYLIVTLPFCCLLLPAFSGLKPFHRALFLALAAFSAFNMLLITSTGVLVLQEQYSPVFGELYQKFFTGELVACRPLSLNLPACWLGWDLWAAVAISGGVILLSGLAALFAPREKDPATPEGASSC